ncbi:putative effector protein [Ceratobasidium theobromae]|uniref:Putative effector protein n=1 Tax=Ceratobasidium theobromae TaxID=1582974 RepID=A0A5N5QB26_9AGAM|nr:putative effector protein [Ceratobasidium theobromae]
MMFRIPLFLLAVGTLCLAAPSASLDHVARNAVQKGATWGGPGGSPFDDSTSLGPNPRLTSITLRGANRLDAISFTLASGKTFHHGGWGGSPRTLTLGRNEIIVYAKLCEEEKSEAANFTNRSVRIHYALVTTNTGRTISVGRTTRFCREFRAPAGKGVVGGHGRSAKEVDRLGFVYAPKV